MSGLPLSQPFSAQQESCSQRYKILFVIEVFEAKMQFQLTSIRNSSNLKSNISQFF